MLNQQTNSLGSAELRAEYYDLVKLYSQKTLSYGTDKFPAFSGLAEVMSPAFAPGEYIAGVWSTELAEGLAWYGEMTECKHVKGEYIAPSWSWAITNDPIQFNRWTPSDGHSGMHNAAFRIVLQDYQRLLKSSRGSVYGQIKFAALDVLVYTKRFVKSRQIVRMWSPLGAVAEVRFDEHDEGNHYKDNHCPVFEIQGTHDTSYLL
jgi:hypothetical protein